MWLEAMLPEVVSRSANLLILPELFACGIGAEVLHLDETE